MDVNEELADLQAWLAEMQPHMDYLIEVDPNPTEEGIRFVCRYVEVEGRLNQLLREEYRRDHRTN